MSEQRLIDYFYSGFWLYLAATIVLIFSSVLIIILRKRLFNHFHKSLVSKLGVYLIVALFVGGSIITGIKFSHYFKDLENVKNKRFETMNATVVGFAVVREGNSPTDPILACPIFKDIDTGVEVTLSINGKVDRGEKYQILYLKNSKIGVVVNKILFK